MSQLISTNLRNFINTFEFRLNVFGKANGDEFITVGLDLDGIAMLLREVDVRRSPENLSNDGEIDAATCSAVNLHLNSLEHELLEIQTRLKAEKTLADGGKHLSDENTRLMPMVDKKVADIRASIRKQQELFA